jgi:hypothetical protein
LGEWPRVEGMIQAVGKKALKNIAVDHHAELDGETGEVAYCIGPC